MEDNKFPALDTIDIHELLPQQPPFVMIDCLLAYDERIIFSAMRACLQHPD